MRAWVAILLLAGLAMAGCLGDEPATGPDETPTEPATSERVQRYTGDGEPVAIPGSEALAEPAYRLTGVQGAEPTLGITSSGNVFLGTFETVIRSGDLGGSWEQVYDFTVEGSPVDPLSNSDPMLWVDPITDRVYDVPMFPPLTCSSVIWSEDEGETWTERHGVCPPVQPFDRQTFSTGPPGPEAPPQAGVAHPTVLYICYNQLPSTSCTMSYDGGLSWPVNQPVWNTATGPAGSEGCAGQNGHPMPAPDGTLVVPKTWNCQGLFVAVSPDNGLTWEVRTGPQVGGDTLAPEIAFTPDGTMYALWQGDDHLTYLARTGDLGQSWDGPWVLSPPDVTSSVFAGLATGDDGRLAAAFLGTDDTDAYPSEANETTRWHLYAVTSTDADAAVPTFTSYQVTPEEDPVQIGCVWIGGGGSPCRNMLDFIDATSTPEGTFVVSYTEGCTDGCAFTPTATDGDSRDRQAALAVLEGFDLGTWWHREAGGDQGRAGQP